VPYILRMVLVLALVLGVIYGLYALLKRSSRRAAEEDTYLKVLASTPVSVGRTLHVVSLGTKAWLIAATETSINLIAEVEDRELIDALILRAAESPSSPRNRVKIRVQELPRIFLTDNVTG